RPATDAYATVLSDFQRLPPGPERWDSAAFEPTLRDLQERFRATNTEEGTVMATMLAYVIEDASTSGRREIITEFRSSPKVQELFSRAVLERDATQGLTATACSPGANALPATPGPVVTLTGVFSRGAAA